MVIECVPPVVPPQSPTNNQTFSPALTTVNGHGNRGLPTYTTGNYLSSQGQQLQFAYHQPPHTPPLAINPSFVHATPSQYQVPRNDRTILSQAAVSLSQTQNHTLSPFLLQADPGPSTSIIPPVAPAPYINPPAPPEPPAPSPEQVKEELLASLRPHLQPNAFTGAAAVAHLTDLVRDAGILEVDPQVRLEIATKIRDNAGNHYFRAWLENPTAMEVTREWLRACVGTDNPQVQETLMPLLQVCTTECSPTRVSLNCMQILDRLPMSVESLRNNRLGKIVVKFGKDAPSPGELFWSSLVRWSAIIRTRVQ